MELFKQQKESTTIHPALSFRKQLCCTSVVAQPCSLIEAVYSVSLGHKQTVEGRRELDYAGFILSLVHNDSI